MASARAKQAQQHCGLSFVRCCRLGFNRFRNEDNPLADPKNKQMLIFYQLVEFLQPRWSLMENVADIFKFPSCAHSTALLPLCQPERGGGRREREGGGREQCTR